MAEKDVLRIAVEQTVAVLNKVREGMAKRVPYGPRVVKRTMKEQRMELQNMDPYAKAEKIQQVGPDQWNEMMKELYNG
tara:strand:- start:63 stop:296 length:234 start_codon:yes stop_codon:yes gene_type:complete